MSPSLSLETDGRQIVGARKGIAATVVEFYTRPPGTDRVGTQILERHYGTQRARVDREVLADPVAWDCCIQ